MRLAVTTRRAAPDCSSGMLCLPNEPETRKWSASVCVIVAAAVPRFPGRVEHKKRKALAVLLECHGQRLEPRARGADRQIRACWLDRRVFRVCDHNRRWRTPSGDDEEPCGRDGCQIRR